MKKVAVVYYSGTGNTGAMAETIAEALKGKADVSLQTCDSFDCSDAAKYDAFAFGCPAMGNEVLEEDSFEPMFSEIEAALRGKNVMLFGSYGWGDGEWMRNWSERCTADGIILTGENVICQDAPLDDTKEKLKENALKLIS